MEISLPLWPLLPLPKTNESDHPGLRASWKFRSGFDLGPVEDRFYHRNDLWTLRCFWPTFLLPVQDSVLDPRVGLWTFWNHRWLFWFRPQLRTGGFPDHEQISESYRLDLWRFSNPDLLRFLHLDDRHSEPLRCQLLWRFQAGFWVIAECLHCEKKPWFCWSFLRSDLKTNCGPGRRSETIGYFRRAYSCFECSCSCQNSACPSDHGVAAFLHWPGSCRWRSN